MLVSAGQYLFSYNFIYLFVLGYAGSPLLCGLFSSCSARASHCGGFSLWSVGSAALRLSGFSSCGSRALEPRHGLSCSVAHGIVPDQGSNPCLLHRQANSLWLSHQGSPGQQLFKNMFSLVYSVFSPFSSVVGRCDGLLRASVFQWDAGMEVLGREGCGVV